MYIIDSFAWLEFFEGTSRGEAVKRILKEGDDVATTSANYYEVFYRIEQKKGPAFRERKMHFIECNVRIIPIDKDIAASAAKIRLTERLSAIDAFTLASARLANGKIVTGDKDFERFKGEVLLI